MTPEKPLSNQERLPSTIIKPMIPKETSIPPLHAKDWLCEVKWNGIRAIVYVEKGNPGAVVIRTKPRNIDQIPPNVAASFPEIKRGMTRLSQNRSLILDGEIVSGNGRAMEDMKNVVRRLSSGPVHVAELEILHPCQYVAFDILYKDGEDLTQLPLDKRKEILNHILPKSLKEFGVHANLFRRRNYDSILRAARFDGYEGVVFKKRHSKYRQGVESNDWLKYKFRR